MIEQQQRRPQLVCAIHSVVSVGAGVCDAAAVCPVFVCLAPRVHSHTPPLFSRRSTHHCHDVLCTGLGRSGRSSLIHSWTRWVCPAVSQFMRVRPHAPVCMHAAHLVVLLHLAGARLSAVCCD